MEKYRFVFISNIPSFYKINLYNKINEKSKTLVIFTNYLETGYLRNADFYKGNIEFDYIVLENKSIISKSIYLLKYLSKLTYEQLILSGWNEFPIYVAALFKPKNKNAVVVESSHYESITNGLRGLVKKLFLKRIQIVYASGKSQKKLVEKLGFKGEIRITKGVGIFNIRPMPKLVVKEKISNFIFVGRLSKEKNLTLLIDTFNNLPELNLTIIGFGPIEEELKLIANNNIHFLGSVDNDILYKYYQSNDVLILPSTSEPWGLVVEEAINNGLPVIISDKVGCKDEIVNNNVNGIIFNLQDSSSLLNAVIKISDPNFYNKLSYNISQTNYTEITNYQINTYLK